VTKHHRRALLTALAVSTAALAAPTMSHADPPDAAEPQRAERFEGTWRLDQPRDEAQQDVAEAVEDAANQFNFVIRGIARSRLQQGTPIHSRVEVSFEGDQVTVRFGNESYTTELGRTEVRQNPEGEDMRVTQRIRSNGQLEQVFETEGGTRRYVYTPLADGRMRIATTTDSPQMPQPMYFMLDYRRAA
jgi:hypothetical protein